MIYMSMCRCMYGVCVAMMAAVAGEDEAALAVLLAHQLLMRSTPVRTRDRVAPQLTKLLLQQQQKTEQQQEEEGGASSGGGYERALVSVWEAVGMRDWEARAAVAEFTWGADRLQDPQLRACVVRQAGRQGGRQGGACRGADGWGGAVVQVSRRQQEWDMGRLLDAVQHHHQQHDHEEGGSGVRQPRPYHPGLEEEGQGDHPLGRQSPASPLPHDQASWPRDMAGGGERSLFFQGLTDVTPQGLRYHFRASRGKVGGWKVEAGSSSSGPWAGRQQQGAKDGEAACCGCSSGVAGQPAVLNERGGAEAVPGTRLRARK